MILGLFVFGLITDVVFCLQVQATTALKNVQAALFTILLTSVGLTANWIIIKTDSAEGFIAYVIGCGVGTYVATTPAIRTPVKKVIRRIFPKK